MTYNDISAKDLAFDDFTSLGVYNSTFNFIIGTNSLVDGKPIDLNDNEFIRIKAYILNSDW